MTARGGTGDPIGALPRNRAGYPIPWVTRWLTEDFVPFNLLTLDDDPRYGSVLRCRCRAGSGRPLLGQQCLERQRAAMLERRCQVCGQPIATSAPVSFAGGKPATYGELAYIEPPMHAECAVGALRGCPVLRFGGDVDDTYVSTAYTYKLFERRLRLHPGDGRDDRIDRIVVALDDPRGPAIGPLEYLVAVPAAKTDPVPGVSMLNAGATPDGSADPRPPTGPSQSLIDERASHDGR